MHLCGHAAAQEPLPQGMKFIILGIERREKDFLRNTPILHFLPKNYLPLGWGAMKFIIFCLPSLQMLHNKFGQDWQSTF